MSGGNPYANGYSSTGATNSNVTGRYVDPYIDPYASQNNHSSTSVNSYGSRERRRGYESSGDVPRSQMNQESAQPAPLRVAHGGLQEPDRLQRPDNRERQNSESGRSRERAPPPPRGINGYKAYSPRRPGKSMEEVLQHINTGWKFMGTEEAVPVQVALRLMDPSTLGLADREADFQETHIDLQKALKSIVNEHHQDFNSSIGTYHKIQSSIQASQSRVRYLKGSLANAKGGLLTTKPELKGLATASQELDDTLQLLGQIENVQAVPEKLEARISEKRFLTAVDVLQEALRLVRRSELDDITAIADLRTYFTSQEQSLTDILIEELHDHLYLKSPYCQDRWKVNSSREGEKDAEASMMRSSINSWDKAVYHYLSTLDTKRPMIEDASRNPEADTFYYMHMLLESLTRLGHLESAINRIEQRMPVELYKVVEKTNNDVDSRHPSHLRTQLDTTRRDFKLSPMQDGRGPVLSEFLWTLYSKFEAIAEGHRVLHEVVTGITIREQLQKPEKYTGGFKELWNLYQSQIRSLLHDYLATNSEATLRTGLSGGSGGDVFVRNLRDRNKRLFKLSEMDQKSSGMKTEQEELDDILKSSVPGLVSKTQWKGGMVNGSGRSAQDTSAAGHKLLADPSVFNITILLPASIAFLQHLKEIVPASSKIAMSTLSSFLDDFLINVFQPQLEEAVTELCTQSFVDLEAFTEDPQWSKYSPRPIFKGSIAFMALIRAFASMLDSIPHDQMFTQLVLSQLVTYYDKCYGWYKANVSRLAPSASNSTTNTLTMKAAAGYAEKGEIHDVVVDLLDAQQEASKRSALIAREVNLILAATRATPLSAYDIISDPKSVHALSLLYNSMQWLSASLAQLRNVDTPISTKGHSRNPSQAQTQPRRWTLLTLKAQPRSSADAPLPVYLPLTTESAIAFDNTLGAFRTLAQTALFTLHIDIRCGIIHQLTRALRAPSTNTVDGTPSTAAPTLAQATRDSALPDSSADIVPWVLPAPPSSASPLVLELNTDLISFDTNTSAYLGARERSFISTGLARLVDRMLVTGASNILAMNNHGAARMGLDVLVLQQNLRNITAASPPSKEDPGANGLRIQSPPPSSDDEILHQSTRYYTALFPSGPEKIMEFVQAQKAQKADVGYSYDELRTLIELCYSTRLRGGREEAMKAKKDSQDLLMRLGEAIWDQ